MSKSKQRPTENEKEKEPENHNHKDRREQKRKQAEIARMIHDEDDLDTLYDEEIESFQKIRKSR